MEVPKGTEHIWLFINGEPEMASCKRYEDGIRVR